MANSATLIHAERDAVLVDTSLTIGHGGSRLGGANVAKSEARSG